MIDKGFKRERALGTLVVLALQSTNPDLREAALSMPGKVTYNNCTPYFRWETCEACKGTREMETGIGMFPCEDC